MSNKRQPSDMGADDARELKKAKRETAPEAESLPQPRGTINTNANADDEGWTKVEKRKLKKAKKSDNMKDSTQPRFLYSTTEITKRKNAIGIEEIRDLVLHLISDAPPPNWLRIDNATQIQRVVTLLIPGLTPEVLALPPLPTSATQNPNLPLPIPLPSQVHPESLSIAIPYIGSTFSHACPTRAPGDQSRMHSVLSTFFQGPVSGEERKRRATERVFSQGVQQDPSKYMLSLQQMIENDYPIPSYMADVFEKPPGWVETPEPVADSLLPSPTSPKKANGTSPSKPRQQIYAIDCEMCQTEDGKELTRVSVIDYYTNIVIYDTLVKPTKPITDYLTRWSGITAEHLQNTTTTLAEVQSHILKLLSPKPANPFSNKPSIPGPTPILLGHSLESDLKALKLAHPYCIDTAIIYHHPRGRPLKPGLAWLTKKWCGREIQTRGEGGHDPREDAQACLDLLKRKILEGPGFGEFKTDMESIFERISRGGRGTSVVGRKCAVVDHGNPGVMHGVKATTSIGCSSDQEVLEGLLGVVGSHQFAFGRFMGVANLLGWTTPKPSFDTPPVPPSPPPSREEIVSVLRELDGRLRLLHAALPGKTAVIIFTGHSDPRKMALLSARKAAFESALKAGTVGANGVPTVNGNGAGKAEEVRWSAADGRELEEAVEYAKRGLVFLGIKQ
ncbi:ribonuclease H [Cyathus striatus]|nr:ribonuclease H [Cyathus striatus]